MSVPPEDELAAALAHQIKTPVAAIQASASNLRKSLRGLMEGLAEMAGASTPCGSVASLLASGWNEPAAAPIMGLLPRDRVEAIERRLAREGVDGDRPAAAARLLRAGWDARLDEIAGLLRGGQGRALDVLETAARMRVSLDAIDGSLRRVGGLASALRLIAVPPGGPDVDLRPGIESAVAMIRQSLPEGVSVRVQLSDMPRIEARPELLAEVWANLLANAAQAVGATGTITVNGQTTVNGSTPVNESADAAPRGSVVVQVVDDGPGISPETLPLIFNPGFTTRGAQGGTGLGLALAERIVSSCGGSVRAESRPGRTCFSVLLPAAAQALRARR